MSDSNIYMALAQSLCFPSSERLERTGGSTRKRVEAGGEGQREGFCSKTEGGVLVMPSVLLTTSGLDGVLRPVHLERKWDEGRSTLNPHQMSIYGASLQAKLQWKRPLMHYELTFDSADQKTALVRQVVNHLEKTKQTKGNQISLSTCGNSGSFVS